MMIVAFVSACIFCSIHQTSSALGISELRSRRKITELQHHNDRSQITRQTFGKFFLFTVTMNSLSVAPHVDAVVMEQPKENVFEVGVSLDADTAKARFKVAQQTLSDLISNYDTISREGGDNVRRYLGTVGTTSALYGIDKVIKELISEAEDVVEYTENMEDFVYYLKAADTACYSANFVEFSAAKTKPEKFLEDAKSDCKNMMVYMNNMAAVLKI